MNPGECIAEFVSGFPAASVPPAATLQAGIALMDYAGVVVAGLDEESTVLAGRMAQDAGGEPQATVWGTGLKLPLQSAALVNGTAAHALDLDDTSAVMMAHPSVQLLPGLCAIAEHMHCGGADVLTAYVIGFEVGAALGRALNPEHVTQGWLPIGTLGPVMAAASCSRLLGLTVTQTRMALGLAANTASGLRCNNGTMAKPLLAGQAASNGVMAALMAGHGATSNPDALTERFGYLENFSRKEPAGLVDAFASLGESPDIVDRGLSFKLYPCCAAAHPAIECALAIADGHGPRPGEIESVEISVHALVGNMLIHPAPRTVAEARFSLEYCVARAVMDSEMGPAQFCQERIDEPACVELMTRIKPVYSDVPVDASQAGRSGFPVEMRIRMKDGREHSSCVRHAKGTPRNPLLRTDLESKFRQCCRGRLSAAAIRDTLELLAGFDRVGDIAELVALLNREG